MSAMRVLIVDDEPEFLRRFSEAVVADAGLQLLAAVATGKAAIALLDAQPPDVMLVDLGLPDIDGVEVIRHAANRCPQCDVLVVTMFGDEQHVVASIEAGATGYLLKDASSERIAASIHELRAGGAPISPSIARRVLARFRIAAAVSPATAAGTGAAEPPLYAGAQQPHNGSGARVESPLTPRETEILRMVAKGLSFETVGEVTGISPHTVVTHVKKIYRKLAVHSRGEAVYEASQMGLL